MRKDYKFDYQNRLHRARKRWDQFIQFETWIKKRKKAILFHPKYVMMTWETYRSLIKTNNKNERQVVILDEFSNLK